MSIRNAFNVFMENFEASLDKGCRFVMLLEDGSYDLCNDLVRIQPGSGRVFLSLPVLNVEGDDIRLRYRNARDAMQDYFDGFCMAVGLPK